MPPLRVTVAVVLLLLLGGCVSLPERQCTGGGQPAVQDTLYFGQSTRQGVVTSDEWARFLEITVTARFPQGLTVLDASGQWRAANGSLVRESTHVLQVVHPDDVANDQRIAEIIAAYKTQFEQESVLRVKVRACASF